MSLNNVELRRLSGGAEFRVENTDTGKYISGYAVVFEQYSKPLYGSFVEIISRNAFDNADMSDVVMVVDHARDVRSVLARSKGGTGTLEITIDDKGVRFRFPVPDTSLGHDIEELVERGDISECSFAFYTRHDTWVANAVEVDGDTYDVRRVNEVSRLADLSIVVNGAYPQTSVGVDERSLAEAACAELRTEEPTGGLSVDLAERIINTL